jgi:hypothetical protein
MRGNLPPKSGETPPEDFEERVNWTNDRITRLISQAQVEGKSLMHSETGEPLTWTAVFSEELGEVVELNDAELPCDPRTRTARIFPCERRESSFSRGNPRMRKAQYGVIWEMSSEEVIPDSFEDIEGIDRELALNNLVELLNAPDAEIVSFEEVFRRS